MCQSFSYFALFFALRLDSMLHPVLVSFLASLSAFLFFFLKAGFPISAFQFYFNRSASRSALTCISVLYFYAILSASYAIRHLGPVRALFTFAAYPALSRFLVTLYTSATHRRPLGPTTTIALVPLFLSTVALVILAHDATGGRIPPAHAAHMRDRVLRNPTARLVHEKFRNISTRVSHSLHNQTLSTYRIPVYSNRRKGRFRRMQTKQRNVESNSDTVSQDHADTQSISDPKLHQRRRLLTIVGAGDSNNTDQNTTELLKSYSKASSSTKDIKPNKRTVSILASNMTNSNSVSSSDRLTLNSSSTLSTSLETNDISADDYVQNSGTEEDVLQLPAFKAILSLIFAVSSPLADRLATDLFERMSPEIGDPVAFISLVFCACSLSLLFYFILLSLYLNLSADTPFSIDFPSNFIGKGALVGLCYFIIPISLLCRSAGYWHKSTQTGRPLKGTPLLLPFLNVYLFNIPTAHPPVSVLYPVSLISLYMVRVFGWDTSSYTKPLSFFSAFSALLMLLVSYMEKVQMKPLHSRDPSSGRQQSSSRNHERLSILFVKRWRVFVRKSIHSLSEAIRKISSVMVDLGVHARSNRASWQVLNFFVLQSGMAIAEVIFAMATHASGLFSISADNFFCSIALAVGLLATRLSSRKASAMYSYGFSRIESVCGFANGIMLIYVAMLIVLESLERAAVHGRVAVGRAFSVCLFGIIGNSLGLYFFPPESRRENHNVQGIYLHILANTLAFSSVALSTATTAILSKWRAMDVGIAVAVACFVVAFAIPLIIRSAWLLLLVVCNEKRDALQSVEDQLRAIPGVTKSTSLRVWNLTPNCIVASVKLEVEKDCDILHNDVLSNARSVFALIGIPASQCTIQISCEDTFREDTSKKTTDGVLHY